MGIRVIRPRKVTRVIKTSKAVVAIAIKSELESVRNTRLCYQLAEYAIVALLPVSRISKS
jgi:hypothetical protein